MFCRLHWLKLAVRLTIGALRSQLLMYLTEFPIRLLVQCNANQSIIDSYCNTIIANGGFTLPAVGVLELTSFIVTSQVTK